MHVDSSDALAADQDLTTFGRARGRLLGGIEQTATCENDRSSRLGSGLDELSSIEHGVDSSSVYSIRLQETERRRAYAACWKSCAPRPLVRKRKKQHAMLPGSQSKRCRPQ